MRSLNSLLSLWIGFLIYIICSNIIKIHLGISLGSIVSHKTLWITWSFLEECALGERVSLRIRLWAHTRNCTHSRWRIIHTQPRQQMLQSLFTAVFQRASRNSIAARHTLTEKTVTKPRVTVSSRLRLNFFRATSRWCLVLNSQPRCILALICIRAGTASHGPSQAASVADADAELNPIRNYSISSVVR